MKKIPVILDCDPGVDDAFAMALLRSLPMFEVRGITTVYGNMSLAVTTRNALALANVLDIACPVAKGADKPLFKRYDRGEDYVSPVHGATGTGDVTLPVGERTIDGREACDLLYEEAKAAEGELVVFAIGPLTNIAKAIRRYPDFPGLVKEFYIMGGGIHMGNQSPYGEANIFKDPTAAAICFENLTTYMVGLNATHAAALTKEEMEEMYAACGDTPGGKMLREMIRFSATNAFEKGSDSNVIHDALTIALATDHTLCTLEHRYVYVEDRAYAVNDGETVVDDSRGAPNTFVAMHTDRDKFRDIMLKMCRYYG